ncbi:hypothetical protein C8J57DRAFT_1322225 [Mycena rebaudengoi]|nr:hypothetical protein C8J57DRAFT_1322225 [Mycena rebaudengoi]
MCGRQAGYLSILINSRPPSPRCSCFLFLLLLSSVWLSLRAVLLTYIRTNAMNLLYYIISSTCCLSVLPTHLSGGDSLADALTSSVCFTHLLSHPLTRTHPPHPPPNPSRHAKSPGDHPRLTMHCTLHHMVSSSRTYLRCIHIQSV